MPRKRKRERALREKFVSDIGHANRNWENIRVGIKRNIFSSTFNSIEILRENRKVFSFFFNVQFRLEVLFFLFHRIASHRISDTLFYSLLFIVRLIFNGRSCERHSLSHTHNTNAKEKWINKTWSKVIAMANFSCLFFSTHLFAWCCNIFPFQF